MHACGNQFGYLVVAAANSLAMYNLNSLSVLTRRSMYPLFTMVSPVGRLDPNE